MMQRLVLDSELSGCLLKLQWHSSNLEASHLFDASSVLRKLLISCFTRARRSHHLLVGQTHLYILLLNLLLHHIQKVSFPLPLMTILLMMERVCHQPILLDLCPTYGGIVANLLLVNSTADMAILLIEQALDDELPRTAIDRLVKALGYGFTEDLLLALQFELLVLVEIQGLVQWERGLSGKGVEARMRLADGSG